MSGTPAKPEPRVDFLRLMQLRTLGRSYGEIESDLGLQRGQGKVFYIYFIRRNANRARRSQRTMA